VLRLRATGGIASVIDLAAELGPTVRAVLGHLFIVPPTR
jgi:hypothetical protein